jgi:hypothetical protein
MKNGGNYDIPIRFAAGYRVSTKCMTALGKSALSCVMNNTQALVFSGNKTGRRTPNFDSCTRVLAKRACVVAVVNARYGARVSEVITVAGCDVTLTLSVGGSVNGVLLIATENCTVEVCTQIIDITVNNKSSKIHR